MLKFLIPLLIVIPGIYGCVAESIKDEESHQIPPILTEEPKQNMIQVEVYTDAMQRDGWFPEEVVVDTAYYQENEVSRGDIIYIVIPEEQADEYSQGNAGGMIVRVVALPNESVKIEEGQIYIEGKELDTFYGREFRWAGGQSAEEISDVNLPEFSVPVSNYLLSGDNWWRSPVNVTTPPIPVEFIHGKVIGYME